MNAHTTHLNVNTIRLGPSGEVVEVIKWTKHGIAIDAVIIKRLDSSDSGFESNQGDPKTTGEQLFGSIKDVTPTLTLLEQRDYASLFKMVRPTQDDLIKAGFGGFQVIPQ